jgi:hypothetical protein
VGGGPLEKSTWTSLALGAALVVAATVGYFAWFDISTVIYPQSGWAKGPPALPPVSIELQMWGGSFEGVIVNRDTSHVINSVVVKINIIQQKKCGEALSTFEHNKAFVENCKKNPSLTTDDVVDKETVECFRGAVRPFGQARCSALSTLLFDPDKQRWSFYVHTVTGKPVDPLGIFLPRN